MIRYTTISIIVKAEEEEINNNESKLSNKCDEILKVLKAWIKVKEQEFPCFNFEVNEE